MVLRRYLRAIVILLEVTSQPTGERGSVTENLQMPYERTYLQQAEAHAATCLVFSDRSVGQHRAVTNDGSVGVAMVVGNPFTEQLLELEQ